MDNKLPQTSDLLANENRRILLIDDNVAIHEDYRKILVGRASSSELDELEAALFDTIPTRENLLDFDVTSAYQGQEGLSEVVQAAEVGRPFALAFVDMRMPPGWNGVETVKRIWEVDPHVQVVICSAYSDHSWSELVNALPSVGQWLLLRKPFDSAEVSQLALALTQKWELERQARERVKDLERVVAERTHELREELQTRLAAQVALRENDARIRAVFDTTQNGIVIFDEVGKLECANRAACQMFGIPETEIAQQNIVDLIVGPDGQQLGGTDAHSTGANLADSAGKYPECLVKNRDLPGMAVNVKVSCFISCSQRMYAALLQDLTSFKRLQSELTQAHHLQTAGQLAVGVVRAIDTPLQYLADNNEFFEECFSSLSELVNRLEESSLSDGTERECTIADLKKLATELRVSHLLEELPNVLQDSTDGVRRVKDIIDSLRAVTGHPHESDREVDLTEILKESISSARGLESGDVQIVTEFAPNVPAIRGFASRLRDTFANLVRNALEATQAVSGPRAARKACVKVTVAPANECVEICISDNGCGISESVQSRVFEPLFTTKAMGDGRGQGLAIARSTIVDGHRGTIEFSSREGEGTTFVVRLPWVATQQAVPGGAQVVNA